MITYEYNKEQQILEVTFDGELNPLDIISFMQEINQNKDLPDLLNTLINAKTANFIFEPIGMQNVVKTNFHLDKRYKMINNAILTNNPNEPALMLYKQYVHGSENYHIEMFEDKRKALIWLKNFK